MKARFLPEVEAEIRAAAQWYEDHQPGLGDRFLDAVLKAQTDIEANPTLYTPPPAVRTNRAIRRRLLKDFPYAMIYEMREQELLVLAVAHGRRKPGYWKRRNG